jgi:hypothetical protein
MKLTGKNPDFVVLFSTYTQAYTVYYKNKFLIGNKYQYRDIASYLN